jgi:hypothetical protein
MCPFIPAWRPTNAILVNVFSRTRFWLTGYSWDAERWESRNVQPRSRTMAHSSARIRCSNQRIKGHRYRANWSIFSRYTSKPISPFAMRWTAFRHQCDIMPKWGDNREQYCYKMYIMIVPVSVIKLWQKWADRRFIFSGIIPVLRPITGLSWRGILTTSMDIDGQLLQRLGDWSAILWTSEISGCEIPSKQTFSKGSWRPDANYCWNRWHFLCHCIPRRGAFGDRDSIGCSRGRPINMTAEVRK